MTKVVIDSKWFFNREWKRIKDEIVTTIGDGYISVQNTPIVDELGVDVTELIHLMLRYELARGEAISKLE